MALARVPIPFQMRSITMHRILAVAALGLALSGFGLAPAAAQEAERTAAVAACTGPTAEAGACEAAIVAFVAAVEGLPDADDLLAGLVIELAVSADAATRAMISAAILVLADAFTDPDRAAAARLIAGDVAAGVPVSAEAEDNLASPS